MKMPRSPPGFSHDDTSNYPLTPTTERLGPGTSPATLTLFILCPDQCWPPTHVTGLQGVADTAGIDTAGPECMETRDRPYRKSAQTTMGSEVRTGVPIFQTRAVPSVTEPEGPPLG
ncbi:hypothetical protein ACOMHN_008237 [Nucella lapillus]